MRSEEKKKSTSERNKELNNIIKNGLEKFCLPVPASPVEANFIKPDSNPIEKKTFKTAMYAYIRAMIPKSSGRNLLVYKGINRNPKNLATIVLLP